MMVVVLALAVVVLLTAPRLGRPLAAAAAARTAADAAALAGAAEGRPAAVRLAEDNGGRLIEYAEFGDEVEVQVRVGSAVARARADASVDWVAAD